MRETANIGADRPGGESTWCSGLVDFIENIKLTEWRLSVFADVVFDIEIGIFVDGLSMGG